MRFEETKQTKTIIFVSSEAEVCLKNMNNERYFDLPPNYASFL